MNYLPNSDKYLDNKKILDFKYSFTVTGSVGQQSLSSPPPQEIRNNDKISKYLIGYFKFNILLKVLISHL